MKIREKTSEAYYRWLLGVESMNQRLFDIMGRFLRM